MPAKKRRKSSQWPSWQDEAAQAVPCESSAISVRPSEPSFTEAAALQWYDKTHRELPWRLNRHSTHQLDNPLAELTEQEMLYKVWVSEVMSQQTQVGRAAEYWLRWMAKWPTVQALAEADLDDINAVWSGLGYYKRASNLHAGAQHVQNKLQGCFPSTSKELQQLPGVGPYVGNAVASIAAGEAVAAVDANVVRVLSRLCCLEDEPATRVADRLHSKLAAQLLSPDRPGDFNQALMELGATVCMPQRTQCQDCPLQPICQAASRWQEHLAAGGAPDDGPSVLAYPRKSKKADRRPVSLHVAVVELHFPDAEGHDQLNYLLVRRPATGLLAGLWEFPSIPLEPDRALGESRAALEAYTHNMPGLAFLASVPCCWSTGSAECQHLFSHISMTMTVQRLTYQVPSAMVHLLLQKHADVKVVDWLYMQQAALSSSVIKCYKAVGSLPA